MRYVWGAIVEEGPADEVLKNPSDGYTKTYKCGFKIIKVSGM